MPRTTTSAVCTSCSGPRNHYVDGVLQTKCAKCHDYAGVMKPNRADTAAPPQSAVPVPTNEAAALLRQINDLLDDERYDFAATTLEGIKATVQKNGHCTERQEMAVQNIEDGGNKWRDDQ